MDYVLYKFYTIKQAFIVSFSTRSILIRDSLKILCSIKGIAVMILRVKCLSILRII